MHESTPENQVKSTVIAIILLKLHQTPVVLISISETDSLSVLCLAPPPHKDRVGTTSRARELEVNQTDKNADTAVCLHSSSDPFVCVVSSQRPAVACVQITEI